MKKFKRVLLVNPYGIGDVLFMTPVLRALRLLPSIESVDVLLGSRTSEIFESNPHVDRIFAVDKDRFRRQGKVKTVFELMNLARELRRRRYDLLIDYSLRGEYALSGLFFLGISARAGFHYKQRGFFHNLRLDLPQGFSGRHMIDFYSDLAEKAGIPVDDRWPEYYLEAACVKKNRGLLSRKAGKAWGRYLVVAPGGGESWGKDARMKQWPASFFRELAAKLAAFSGCDGIAVIGSSAEEVREKEVLDGLTVPAVGLCGKISMAQAAAVIEGSSLFLGNDGGLLHLACARRKPVIGIYGPTDPEVYGPYPPGPDRISIVKADLSCRPCYQKFRYRSDCPHLACLKELNSHEVWSMLERSGFLNGIAIKPLRCAHEDSGC